MPGQPPGVHELRTLDDALALRARIADGTARVVVVGAGFIGLEVAATARALGCAVTVLEGLPAPLVRGLGAELGVAATRVHVEQGIDLRCDVAVADVPRRRCHARRRHRHRRRRGRRRHRRGAGHRLAGRAARWRSADGVVCDATLRTAVPGVFAAGDVARWPHAHLDEELRIEHWTNAAEQGAAVAANLLAEAAGGERRPYAAVPFFWSDQGRHRIQMLGRPASEPGDITEVVVGTLAGPSFVVLFGRAGRLRGALGVNAARHLMAYQRLLAERVSWDDALALSATQQS